jgi:hypothetical protein
VTDDKVPVWTLHTEKMATGRLSVDACRADYGYCEDCFQEKVHGRKLNNIRVVPEAALDALRAALYDCLIFLEERDKMNAAVHCQDPRWSPLTERVRAALAAKEGE